MKVVALVSGGKDSCYNMVCCIKEGHDIVALANLYPKDKDELDSYMYQSVGQQGLELYAEAMGGIPLFREPILGLPLAQGATYSPTDGDEVEDLFRLLSKIRQEVSFEAVSVGAIFSSYQAVRVENICERLGIKMLAYLWHREQKGLLKEMVQEGIHAILIKVAAMGLLPQTHLGMTLEEIQPHMIALEEKYGLNVCGEGGEYETFTLDCPLFKKKIIIDEQEIVIHSNDAFAPVGFLRFKKMHLEDKSVIK